MSIMPCQWTSLCIMSRYDEMRIELVVYELFRQLTRGCESTSKSVEAVYFDGLFDCRGVDDRHDGTVDQHNMFYIGSGSGGGGGGVLRH